MNNLFMAMAIELSLGNVRAQRGGPFGAVVVKAGEIIASGTNLVTSTGDPTAHAEIVAIRNACKVLGDFQLTDCDIYSTCEPCPMCLGAIYWARPRRIFFANTRQDAASIGFDDSFIYDQIAMAPEQRSIPAVQIMRGQALAAFELWRRAASRMSY